jgi:hypothetical protein
LLNLWCSSCILFMLASTGFEKNLLNKEKFSQKKNYFFISKHQKIENVYHFFL